MSDSVHELLAKHIPGFSLHGAGARFAELGVDSSTLVEQRLGVEQLLGPPLPDAAWRKAVHLA